MQQNILERLTKRQLFEYQHFESFYGTSTALRYASLVTSDQYLNRSPLSAPRMSAKR